MFCKQCGANNPDGSAFCSSCGYRFTAPGRRYQPPSPPAPSAAPAAGKRTGLVILVVVLALAAAAAVTLLCLKLFSTQPQTAAFADASAALAGREAPAAQALPGETTTPTPAPTAAQAGPAEYTCDLDTEFVQLFYPEGKHVPAGYAGDSALETALQSMDWHYVASQRNPDAAMINGGYIDIGPPEDFDANIHLRFESSGELNYLSDETGLTSLSYTGDYQVEMIDGWQYALVDIGEQTVIDATTYDLAVLYYIDTQGILVESAVLIDIDLTQIIFMSNFNVYEPVPEVVDDESPFGALDPAVWDDQSLFEQALTQGTWVYAGSDVLGANENADYYLDITPTSDIILEFRTDGTLDAEFGDSGTGELFYETTEDYGIGVDHAYYYFDDYETDEELLEVDRHYYIDVNGNLIETVRLYSFEKDEYTIVSNANVYVPYQP